MFKKLRNWLIAGALALCVPFMLATQYPVHRWTSNQFITDGNGLVVGHTAQVATNITAEFQVLGTSSTDARFTFGIWSADVFSAGMDFVKSRNTTIGADPGTIVEDNDQIGAFRFMPDDGVDYATAAARFMVLVDDASPAAGDIGTEFLWEQMPGGGGVLRQTMRLSAAGDLLIANAGGVVIGHTAQVTTGQVVSELQLLGTGEEDSHMILGRFGADTVAPGIDFIKSRGTTIGALGILLDNDTVGTIRFYAADAADLATEVARFMVEVDDGSPADGDIGAAFVWRQMPGGTGAIAETMRLATDGTLTVVNDVVIDDQLAVGGAVVTGAKIAIEFADVQRNIVTAVGHTLHVPADSMVINDAGSDNATITLGAALSLGIPTYTATAGTTTTVTEGANLHIVGAPVGGSEVSITSPYALWVDAGESRFDGPIFLNSPAEGTATQTYIASRGQSDEITLNYPTGGLIRFRQAQGDVMQITAGGEVFIGNESANANMTVGLTIQQSTNDDQIFALKSGTDVATALTTIVRFVDVETDDIFTISKRGATTGGVVFQALGESTVSQPFTIDTWGGAPATTEVTTTVGAISFHVGQHNNANADVDMAAGSSGFTWGEIDSSSATVTRMILKADDGELFLGIGGVSPTDFSSHNDIAIIADVEDFRVNGRLIADYATMAANGKYAELVAVGLIGDVSEEDWNDGVRPLQSIQRSVHLLNGNARQERAMMNAMIDVMEEDPSFRGKLRVAMQSRGVGHLARP